MKGINKEEALQEIKEAQRCGDTEIAHRLADDALCGLLISLGYQDVVDEYCKVDKWYA